MIQIKIYYYQMEQMLKKNKKTEGYSIISSYTPIHILLKNRQEGLFQQSITNQNIIDALRKGKLFHRKIALNASEKQSNEMNDHQEQIRNQFSKNYNMDESTKIEEQMEEAQNFQKNKSGYTGYKTNSNKYNIRSIKQLKQHKIDCYQTKLFNKDVKKINGYRSCDFQKLKIKLPQLKLSDGFGNINMKKQIKNILDNYKFVNEMNKKYEKNKDSNIETLVPKFLLNMLNTTHEIQFKKQIIPNIVLQNKQFQKINKKSIISNTIDTRPDKNYYTLYVQGLSI